jgi:hypothetical protein
MKDREKGLGCPDGAPNSQLKPNQPEQSPQGGSNKSPERQPLPNVWDILERKARASDEFLRGRMSRAEYDREQDAVELLKVKVDEKGIDRDKHILALLFYPRPTLYSLSRQLEKVHQLRSQVELLSDEELADCARRQAEEIKAFQKGKGAALSFHPSAGDGEIILEEHIAKKG